MISSFFPLNSVIKSPYNITSCIFSHLFLFIGCYNLFSVLWNYFLLAFLSPNPPHSFHFPHRSLDNLANFKTDTVISPVKILHTDPLCFIQCKPHPPWCTSVWHVEVLKNNWEKYGNWFLQGEWSGSLWKGHHSFAHFPTHLFKQGVTSSWAQKYLVSLLVNALYSYIRNCPFLLWKYHIHLTHGYGHCGFYGFISLMGLQGKLSLLFWESTSQNIYYSVWKRNGICQIEKDLVNEDGNSYWLQILKWQKIKECLNSSW